MSDPKTRRRRYRQFSLRTFLVVLTVVLVWFGWQVNRANQRRKTVEWVLETGGFVVYDYEVVDQGRSLDPKPVAPWLRDYRAHVVFVSLENTQVRDLAPLANLTSLEILSLDGTQVSDLAPLENLNSLERLELDVTPVSDLTLLANLKSLRRLNVSGTQVSEEQITKLQQALPNCVIVK